MNDYIIEMLNITKEFPGIIANDNITLQLKKGEIHALLGENGAGKSTLMSVLFGLYQPEKGTIKKNGEVVKISSPNDATALNIGMVHQHFKLVGVFSVLDNIILGNEPLSKGFINRKKARLEIEEISKKYGLLVDLDSKVDDITVGMQQRVEILKMLYRKNDILIFDEPTAVLTPQEIDELMNIMNNLKQEGKSILFITHKLNEIMKVADRCTVLRKGKYVGTVDIKSTTKDELSEMMVGRKVNLDVSKPDTITNDVILEVDNISVESNQNKTLAVKDVSFKVNKGEIVCIAGIDGNGQSELIYGLTGIKKIKKGHVYYNSKDITNIGVRNISKEGISHIPEDRHKHGLILDYSLEQNMILQRYYEPEFTHLGFLRYKNIRNYSNKLIDEFDVRSGEGPLSIVRQMSGGNQQKAIIAREVDKNHDLLIAVNPTRGLDVGAIEFIHKTLINERNNGKAIILVSFELDEVMNLADKILVMYEGKIVGNLTPKDTTIKELGLYMAGAKTNIGDDNE